MIFITHLFSCLSNRNVSLFCCFIFETGSQSVTQASIELLRKLAGLELRTFWVLGLQADASIPGVFFCFVLFFKEL